MRWLLLCLVACTSPRSPTPPSATPPSATPAPPAPPPPAAAKIISHADLVARLEAQGAKVKRLATGEILACPPHGRCVCLTELTCKGDCITLQKNLAAFDQALHGDNAGRSVSCEIADTGTLCDTSYFRFEGDIYRWEDRFFDASGHLIGQRNATDYPEYCQGGANTRYMGAVPDCRQPARDVKVICSDDENKQTGPLGNPMERLLGSVAD